MDTDITLVALSYVLVRLAVLASIGYLFYRILRQSHTPASIRIERDRAPVRNGHHRNR
jgi:hypothetical protein